MLEQEEDLTVVGEAQSGEQAVAVLKVTPVDVVLLDIRMPGMDGIDTLRALKRNLPDLTVIMLTSYGDEYLSPSIDAGANGYMLKRANRAEMVKAIREAVDGGAPLDSQVTPGLINRLRNPSQPLSPREAEVLQLVASGHSNRRSASSWACPDDHQNHLTSIMQKLDANDRAHAVTIALRKGWIANPL